MAALIASVASHAAAVGLASVPALLATAALVQELRRRRELLARACHEVRGPLSAAGLVVQAAARRGELPPARAAALELELRRAALALDDLHAAGRGEASPAKAARDIDVGALLVSLAPTWDAAARARGVRVAVADVPPVTVRGDALRLAQALTNLVMNAVEHGRGTVEVRVGAFGERVRVAVVDEGSGLPAPLAHLVARAQGGRGRRGRGLAIAQAAAASLDGELRAVPSTHATCLVIDLPAASRAVGDERSVPAARGPAAWSAPRPADESASPVPGTATA